MELFHELLELRLAENRDAWFHSELCVNGEFFHRRAVAHGCAPTNATSCRVTGCSGMLSKVSNKGTHEPAGPKIRRFPSRSTSLECHSRGCHHFSPSQCLSARNIPQGSNQSALTLSFEHRPRRLRDHLEHQHKNRKIIFRHP